MTYMDVREDGLLDFEALKGAIRPDTILVSVLFVNNEIGWETHPTQSTKSRAEVVAELKAAQDAGAIADSYEFSSPTKVSPSKLRREQVQRGVTEISDAERDAVHRMYGPQHGRDS